jgi:non-ribosomal peptide synthetase component E (peptide arylation enzyme)
MQEEAANVPGRVHPSEQWWRYNATSRAGVVPPQQVRWSYAELKRRVDLLAAGLLSL